MRHPAVSLLLGVGVDLVHFWLAGGGADEKHGFLLVRHLPDNQLLKRDHRRLVVLGSKEKNEGKEEEEAKGKISDCRIFHSHCEAVQVFPQDTHCLCGTVQRVRSHTTAANTYL